MRRPLVALVLVLVAGAAGVLTSGSEAATPATQSVTAPTTPGQTVTRTWSGTIPNLSDGTGTSSCKGRATGVDAAGIHIDVPAGAYDNVDIDYKFTITWTDATGLNDEVLTVVNQDVDDAGGGGQDEGTTNSEVGSSDTSATTEQVVGSNLPTANYEAQACPFAAATPQSYTGRLDITAKAKEADLPAADDGGLGFSASVPADPQRDAGEPLIEIDKAGNAYTCGPSGFSNAAEYAQVSTDGGDQFHLLGEPPRGQIGLGGGGDCSIATAPDENAQNRFNLAYSGLGPLTGFTVSRSQDQGRTMESLPNSNSVPGVDRQWQVYLDAQTVLLNYNRQAPRQVIVQKSTDGGLNYTPGGVAATPANPSFPGPMRALPAQFNPTGAGNGRVAYFSWNDGTHINLSVSFDQGDTWTDCRAATAPGDPTLFTTSDSDSDGRIYIAYGENAKFHTYVTSLATADLGDCDEALTAAPKTNPGFAPPVQVDRGKVRSSLFAWLTAGGAPGRVAVAFYGTETDGDPNMGDFRGSWNVYVNQSPDAGANFSQVKATTHPVHYDSICLNGLGCDVSGGDRSLADFFAIDYDPVRKALQVVYDTTYKKPGEAAGHVATPTVVTQTTGPSLGGGSLTQAKPPVVRTSSADPAGDAIADYSSLESPPSPAAEPAADFRSATIAPGPRDGFAVTMKLADLSDAALATALSDTNAPRLLWIFRFFNGYQSSAAVARYTASGGFSFGFNDFQTGNVSCGSSGEKCLQYPGDQPITGRANQAAGTITLEVPASKLKALSGPEGPGQRPKEVAAKPGDRLYDGTAFSLADVSPSGGADQSFLYPLDNAPSMDFLVPASSGAPGGGTPSATPSSGAAPSAQDALAACRSRLTFSSVSARPRGSRADLRFSRRGAAPVQVDVFQSTVGRRVIGERLIARFANRKRSFTWNGRANRPGKRVRDGYLFVRFRTGGGRGESRRVALRRIAGRLSRRAGFQRRDTCDLLTSYKLQRPAFGGTARRSLGISFRLSRAGTARLRVTRGAHTVKTYSRRLRANRKQRLRLSARGLPKGDYRFRLVVRSGRLVTRSQLLARRL
ncbi:MAG: sialidase family protein [Solirubrobacteraceae bacterium]